jgi:hypothetical protein
MRWEDPNLPEAWGKFERHVKLMFTGPLKAKMNKSHIYSGLERKGVTYMQF